MGTLKPGATYIYERADGVTYAREFGASTRTPIGWDNGADGKSTIFGMESAKVAELIAIAQAAQSNPALHDALERVKMLYALTKDTEHTE